MNMVSFCFVLFCFVCGNYTAHRRHQRPQEIRNNDLCFYGAQLHQYIACNAHHMQTGINKIEQGIKHIHGRLYDKYKEMI